MRQSQVIYSVLLLLLLGFLWGSGYVLAKYAITSGVHPLGYSFWQSLGPSIILSSILLLAKKYKSLRLHYLPFYIFCGLVGIAIPNSNMFFVAQHVPSGLLSVVVNTVPIFTYVLSFIFLKEKFNFLTFLALIMVLIGLGLLFIPGSQVPGLHNIGWIILALITPICFASTAVFCAKFFPKGHDPLSLATMMMISATILLMPLVFFTNSFYYISYNNLHGADYAIFVEMILSSLGYVIFFEILRVAGPVFYGFISSVVALVGILLGYFIFDEKIIIIEGVSILLILIGLIIVSQGLIKK